MPPARKPWRQIERRRVVLPWASAGYKPARGMWRQLGWQRGRLPLLTLGLLLASGVSAAWGGEDKLLFNRDIRPILSDNCFTCHGPDGNRREAGLRLDVRDEAIGSQVFVPGEPEASELVARLDSDDADLLMPPPDSHKRLTTEQRGLLKRWIAEGAEYQGHWAYEAPVKPATPAGVHAMDYLIGQQLARRGLEFAPEADGRTLVRRLYFDLIGLPPGPETVDAFLSDAVPGAYERLVERLLSKPQYGERMAIPWLDVVRFADTIGYHSDNPRNVWPYRDYVIRAFNDNKPFDQFTIEQLAGDLLPDSTQEQRVASCFNRLLLTTEEGGAQPKDYETRMLTDRVRAVGTVWLGQTLGCCQCHDHKFDPATARDFYSLGAFFADIQEPILGRREEGMLVLDEQQQPELERLRSAVAAIETQSKPEAEGKLAEAKQALSDYEKTLPRCLVSSSLNKPRTVRILPRGDWMDDSGEIVQPALPAYLPHGDLSRDRRLNRLDLARWLVSRDNPLTARVFVNRLWKQFFGSPLSKVPEDLGSQGEWPVHPELLDWLACEFMDSGWDVKHLVRTLVCSRTYRQASTANRELLDSDPDNRQLARQSRFRLDAELVRDNALCIAGLLASPIGGPSVKPYQPEGYWENLNFPPRTWVADTGAAQYRRGLYTWWQRSFLHPSLLAFDAPSREECAADRTRSNLPQQALVLLNDPTYIEAARVFAARILTEGGSDRTARLTWAWRQALQRNPREEELQIVTTLLDKHQVEYVADVSAATAMLQIGLAPAPPELDPAELAAWTSVARVLLNLHETVTRS